MLINPQKWTSSVKQGYSNLSRDHVAGYAV